MARKSLLILSFNAASIVMQMAHVDAYDSYNMILGETSGYIQSSFLDDTGCTETEKRHFNHCEKTKSNQIQYDATKNGTCDGLKFIVKDCFPILKNCLTENKMKVKVKSYLKNYVVEQEDFESLQRIQNCPIIKENVGSNDERIYCTQNMLNKKYGQWFQCNIKTFKNLEQKLLALQKSNSGLRHITRSRNWMYSQRSSSGQSILLRSDVKREFCEALRELTEEKCGKIAEKCEPRENIDAFRNAHRLNVGAALNKFIFGNAQLYTNNFVNTEQCKGFNNWDKEEDRNGEHNHYASLETSSENDNVWVLENNEVITEEPIFFDPSLQQPLKSKGITLNTTPFLRLGELGIIVYQIINGAL